MSVDPIAKRSRGVFVRCLLLVTAFLFGTTAFAAEPNAPDSRRPNVVLFLVDDMGWMDSGVYGSKYYETPNIDSLADRGMLFTDAYSAHPLCSPTRASILTGQYPARHGITSAAGHRPPAKQRYAKARRNRPTIQPQSQSFLDPKYHTLPEALADVGYATGHFGKWHLGLTKPHWPERQGYDVAWHGSPDPGPPLPNGYFSPYSFKAGTIKPAAEQGAYIVDHLTDEACRFVKNHRDGPFFLSVWQFGVHGPWGHKEAYTKEFAKKTDSTGRGNPIMASMLRSIDESLGRIVNTLDELELTENTMIVFTSDNGGNVHSNIKSDGRTAQIRPGHRRWPSLKDYRKYAGFLPPTNNAPLRAGKGRLYEGGVRVPLIVVWPGMVPKGARSSEVVSSIDLYPTLLELLNISKKRDQVFDGVSFASVLRDPNAELERNALFNFFPHGGPGRAGVTVRTGHWKLIRWFGTNQDHPSRHELYNLARDLGETTNLANKYPRKVDELDARIDQFLAETGALVPKPNPAHRPN